MEKKGTYFEAPTQKRRLNLVIEVINNNKVDAEGPNLVFVSGDIPSDAFITRKNSELEVHSVRRVRNLDPR